MKKKLLQLICLFVSILTIFNVKALDDQVTLIEKEKPFFENIPDVTFHFKSLKGDDSAYAFCLDSNLSFQDGMVYASNSSIFPKSRANIEQIILKAYLAGLNTDSNIYGLTNRDFYAVTQMAVWKAAHGSDKGGLRSSTYLNFLNDSKYPARIKAFNDLMSSNKAIIPNYSLSVNSDSNKLSKDGEYLVSLDYTLVSDSKLKFTVSVDSTDSSACILYGDSCKASQKISSNETFKLRVNAPKSGNGNVSVKANISSESFVSGYDFKIYAPTAKTNDGKTAQNAALFKPKYSNLSASVEATGNYENKISTEIEVQKINENNHKVEGAVIGIFDSSDKKIKEVITTKEGASNEKISLDAGNYYIKELEAPKGYVLNNDKVEFSIDNEGKLLDREGKVLSIKTLSIKDQVYISVSKTDIAGKEVEGAHIEIYEGKNKITEWVSETKTHIIEGLKFNVIYELKETVAPVGFQKLETSIYFVVNENGSTTTCNVDDVISKNVCTAMSTEDILKIVNEPVKTGIYISKRDLTTGEELPGAHLQILNEMGEVVAEWTSTSEPYYIDMLPIGKYSLIETLNPENYSGPMYIDGQVYTTKYDFEITGDEIKKIDVYNEIIPVPNTGINVTSTYVIGSMIIIAGIATVVISRRKQENN